VVSDIYYKKLGSPSRGKKKKPLLQKWEVIIGGERGKRDERLGIALHNLDRKS